MSGKWYAVARGLKPGVYQSWAETKEQVYGTKGAVYKSFSTEEEAEAFVYNNRDFPLGVPGEVYAWVDGSNLEDGSRFSGSVSVEVDGKEIWSHYDSSSNDQEDLRNILGEITGALMAIQYMKDNGLDRIHICHDYVGVGSWPNGYDSKSELGKRYKKYVNELRAQGYDIRFIKVKGHDGLLFNERADWLAREALSLNKKDWQWP